MIKVSEYLINKEQIIYARRYRSVVEKADVEIIVIQFPNHWIGFTNSEKEIKYAHYPLLSAGEFSRLWEELDA